MNIQGEAPCHDYCEILRDSEASCEDYCEILMLAPCHDYCEIFAILREGFIVTASIRHLASVTRPCCREISTNQRPVSWSHDHSQPIRGQGVRNLWQYFPPVCVTTVRVDLCERSVERKMQTRIQSISAVLSSSSSHWLTLIEIVSWEYKWRHRNVYSPILYNLQRRALAQTEREGDGTR